MASKKQTGTMITAGKISDAKKVAAYRVKELKDMKTGTISGGLSKGGTVVSTKKSRTEGLNAVNSSAKTAGRAKNVSRKLGKAADAKYAASKAAPKGVSAIGAVAKRFNVTAKEARDIARAVGNVAESARASRGTGSTYGKAALKASVKDLKKQVKETGKAAITGKKGTPAGKLKYDVDTGKPFGLRKTKERQNFIQ